MERGHVAKRIHQWIKGGSNDEIQRILGDFDKICRGIDAPHEGREKPDEAALGFYSSLTEVLYLGCQIFTKCLSLLDSFT